MAKLKMLKLPAKPKLSKKPKANASLAAMQNWMSRNKEARQKYYAACQAVTKANAERTKANNESIRLHKVISGIGSIETFPSKFTTRSIREPRKGARKTYLGVTKRKVVKKKTAPKKKAVAKRRKY